MYALIFDCDGVLADTERYGHLPAFNRDLRRARPPGPVRTEREYGVRLQEIAGGKERMASALTPAFVEAAEAFPRTPRARRSS